MAPSLFGKVTGGVEKRCKGMGHLCPGLGPGVEIPGPETADRKMAVQVVGSSQREGWQVLCRGARTWGSGHPTEARRHRGWTSRARVGGRGHGQHKGA